MAKTRSIRDANDRVATREEVTAWMKQALLIERGEVRSKVRRSNLIALALSGTALALSLLDILAR